MDDRAGDSLPPRRASLPRIPSNLRIRRPRDSALGAVVARDTLPEGEVVEQRSVLEDVAQQAQTRQRPDQQSSGNDSRRPSSQRRRGAVESLAMSDRIAATQQKQSRAAAYEGSTSVPAESSSISSEAAQSSSRDTRPRLFTKASDSRLPAVSEVASPVEAPVEKSPLGTRHVPSVFTTANGQTEEPQHDYFPSSSRSLNAASSSHPALSSGASVPLDSFGTPLIILDDRNLSKDDAILSDGGGRLARKPSNISIPTPLTERSENSYEDDDDDHHAAEVADYLDVVDAEVGALGYLTNIQNSIFVPNIPALYDRRPVHDLPRNRKRSTTLASLTMRGGSRRGSTAADSSRRDSRTSQQSITSELEQGRASALEAATGFSGGERTRPIQSRRSVLTRMTSAVGLGSKKPDEDVEVAKHIRQWRDMDEHERNELDEHVRLVLTKRSKFRRGLKGFWAFFKTPMGFIMTMYGFLITFWGTAIMLFIFSWIKVGERRRYWIEICDQILCALFAAVGLGFAPFRAVDTYRMIWISKMHYRTWERRKALGLGDLDDPNDLPRPEDGGRNQVLRVDKASRVPRPRSKHSDLEQKTASNDIEMTAGKASDGASHKARHWWDIGGDHKHAESTGGGQDSLLSPQTSQVSDGSGSHKKTKKGHFVVPEPVAEEDLSGKVGDLKRPNRGQTPLKRNDSIKSELVKDREDIVVLTKEEQELLEHHQRKFHQSHSFYRFHETATHRAFPLDLMITIVCLLDCHSILQGALGACTWGIKYTHRPTALTATLITCSLSCNAVAGLLIYVGGRKTKKREEVERRLRIALEAMALEKIERRRARGELPDRPGQQGKSDSDSQRPDVDSSDTSGEEKQQEGELREAVDSAARTTEDEDQALYDEPSLGTDEPNRQDRSSLTTRSHS